MAKEIIELKEPINKIEFYLNEYELEAFKEKLKEILDGLYSQ